MCGRFTLRANHQELQDVFPFVKIPELRPRYNIAPSQDVAALRICGETNQRECVFLRWGFLPPWAKSSKDRPQPINARLETAIQSRMFGPAFRRRRCAVLADGFYEWHVTDGRKLPYYIRLAGHRPFAFAGLWSEWRSEEGAVIGSCTILTTQANELVRSIHERMPVILLPTDVEGWLDQTRDDVNKLSGVFRPLPAAAMEAYRVGLLVNNPRNDEMKCIEPAG